MDRERIALRRLTPWPRARPDSRPRRLIRRRSAALDAATVVSLQTTIGNDAVTKLLARHQAAAAASRRENGRDPTAITIAGGHAYGKHVIDQGEFPGVTDPDSFATVVDRVMKSPEHKTLSGGRHAYWDDSTRTVVIVNPNASDKGTCFRPHLGKNYYANLH